MYSASGTLTSLEQTTVIVRGEDVPGEFEHTIDATLGYLGIQPMLGFRISRRFRAYAGGRIGFVTVHDFHQSETIIEPSETGTFNNGLRTRNDTSGSIPSIRAAQMGLAGGLGLHLPLTAAGTFSIMPALFYTFGLTTITSAVPWRVGSLQLGVSFRYSPKAEVHVPVVAVVPESQPNQPGGTSAPQPPASIVAVGVESDGAVRSNVTLRIEEFISTHMRPLLGYLFFDENSAQLPPRYARLDPARAEAFRIAALHDVATLPTYYQLLNIVGRRMRDYPSATITIVGCNADHGAEAGNTGLSRQRAETVRDYLVATWGIAADRMKIETRNLPAEPTNPADPDGDVENRRVEIIPDRWEILEPVITDDTLRTVTPPTVRFRTNVQTGAGVARWVIRASQNGRLLKELSGTGRVPDAVDWHIEGEQESIPRAPEPIVYELRMTDSSGHEIVALPGSLPVDQMTLRRKRTERIADREIDRYGLILFDFDRADLDEGNRRIAEFIRGRIKPSATVSITGHTDRVGEADHNLKLSQERAATVASALGRPAATITGEGESSQLYDNNLPEGRFYSRTVSIVVETPISVQ
jgi:outer membrane protein OmpA-like peptidoglycan-associated protein